MRGIGPFSPQLKLFLTIGTSVLTLVAIITPITKIAASSPDWPYFALVVAFTVIMIVMVRRTATTGDDPR